MLSKIGSILETIWGVLTFIPTGIEWIFNTIIQVFAVFVRVKGIMGVFTNGSITSNYIPIEYFRMLAPLVGIVLFFGFFTIMRRVI